MSSFRIRLFCLLTLAASFVPFIGCSNVPTAQKAIKAEEKPSESINGGLTQEAKIRLKIFTQYSIEVDEKQPFDYAYAQMKKVMPNVELEIDIQPQDDSNKLKIYAASGSLPDIIQVTAGITELFKSSGNLLILDQYVKDTKIEDRILPMYKDLLWSGDGHCYAVPRTAPSTHLMFYNKELFEKSKVKVPADYDEFITAIKEFRTRGITPLALFAKETWPGVMLYEDFITRYEPKGLMKIDHGKGSLTEAPYIKAANQLQECVKAGLLSKSAFTADYETAFAEFTTGKAAMLINGSWALGPLGEKMGDKVDYMDFPLADRAIVEASVMNRPGGGFDGGYSVSTNTKYPEIAAKYACLFALEIANGRVIKAGMPNPLTNDGVKPEKPYPAISLKYAEQVKYFRSTTVFPWALNSKAGVILGDNCAKLLTGSYPVDKFIEDTDKEIREVLKK
ncbi:MAG: extracellular solute-binding protein [Clostridia bacterium]|nr:extracellular solute-binding protein [Clostridia bacterium]